MSPTWKLDDVEVQAREHASFYIPSREERTTLQPGTLARLHFVLLQPGPEDPRAERMWVEVDERLDEGRYRGRLTNEPAAIADLQAGDWIEFGPEHVAQLLIKRDDPRWYANAEKRALVSESVFEDCCRWLYHEDPDNDEDSGWRLFAGTETDEELRNTDRIRLCNVTWLCNVDPSLAPLLRREDDVAYERTDVGEEWTLVEGWRPLGN